MTDAELLEQARAGDGQAFAELTGPYRRELLDGIPDHRPGPEARYEASEVISLAFITALQLLPPRQRAALILCDVLGFRAGEAAGMLGSTYDAVASALKHARATMARHSSAG